MMSFLDEGMSCPGSGSVLLAGLGRLAHEGELVDARQRGATDGPVDRLPARAVLAEPRDDVRRRRVPPVLADAVGLDQPAVAVAGPVALAVSAFGVEDPGLDLVPHRVPADPLRAREHRLALRLHRELADE